jgi:hypothetical protein
LLIESGVQASARDDWRATCGTWSAVVRLACVVLLATCLGIAMERFVLAPRRAVSVTPEERPLRHRVIDPAMPPEMTDVAR